MSDRLVSPVTRLAWVGCLCWGGLLVAAEEEPAAPAEEAPPPWRHEARIGLFLDNSLTRNSDTSRDPSISGATEAIAWQAKFDGKLTWQNDPYELVNLLSFKYGRQKQEDEDWIEKSDLIDYDGTFKRLLAQPHYMYLGWGLESVVTGAEPDEEPFDPTQTNVSGGYGQHYESATKGRWMFDWRVGARVQRTFGRGLGDEGRQWETGPELRLRYEAKPQEMLSYWLQYDAFSEFEDLGHVSHTLTVGLTCKVTAAVNVDVGLRAYYEHEPDDAPAAAAGYDELSYHQETLIGLVYSF